MYLKKKSKQIHVARIRVKKLSLTSPNVLLLIEYAHLTFELRWERY